MQIFSFYFEEKYSKNWNSLKKVDVGPFEIKNFYSFFTSISLELLHTRCEKISKEKIFNLNLWGKNKFLIPSIVPIETLLKSSFLYCCTYVCWSCNLTFYICWTYNEFVLTFIYSCIGISYAHDRQKLMWKKKFDWNCELLI